MVEMIPFRKNDDRAGRKTGDLYPACAHYPQSQKRSGNAYAENSVLSSGRWYKIAVSNEGMYKLDYNFIKNKLNLDPGSFSLNTLAVYGNGGGMVPDENNAPRYDDLAENPTLLQDNNSNNRFDEGDYFLFYGQMPDEWKYDAGGQTFSHLKNLYTDKTYYFITPDAGTGKRVPLQTNTSVANKTITQFDEHAYRDVDEESVLKSGKIWLGDKMTSFNNTSTFNFNFPNLVTSTPVRLKSSVAAKTSSGLQYAGKYQRTTIDKPQRTGHQRWLLSPGGFALYSFCCLQCHQRCHQCGLHLQYQQRPYGHRSGVY
jgi:hypothetical protein